MKDPLQNSRKRLSFKSQIIFRMEGICTALRYEICMVAYFANCVCFCSYFLLLSSSGKAQSNRTLENNYSKFPWSVMTAII